MNNPIARHQPSRTEKERILIIREVLTEETANEIIEDNNHRPVWKKIERIVSEERFITEEIKELFRDAGLSVTPTIFVNNQVEP